MSLKSTESFLIYLFLTIMVLLAGLQSLPSVALAQSVSSILVDIAPPNPAPFENTTITLNSYADHLDSVLIKWSVGGKNVSSGIGKKTFSINAPAAGGETSVVATISLPAGDAETRIIIRPSVMVLLWQANDSYVPPFYRGKALPTPDSEVKVVAMPEVRTSAGLANPKNMTYAWKKDYTNVPDGSGYGKNFFLYANDFLESSNNISVVASTVDQLNSTESSIDIGTIQPKILFYKKDSNLGILWEQALADGHKIQGSEIVLAIPFFISPNGLQNPMLTWSWFINDNLINLQTIKKNVIPLQAQSGVSGTSKLRLQIDNQFKIFQTTSKEINIEF